MTQVNLIAAVGRHGQLGLGGKIPWSDPGDLRWFKQMTTGGIVVMGTRTFRSIMSAGFPGEDRALWVVDHKNYDCLEPTDIIRFVSDGIVSAHNGKQVDTIWVAGGAFVYRLWMPYVRRAFITLDDYDGPADTWMPPLWS